MKLGPLEIFVKKVIGIEDEGGKPLLIRWKIIAIGVAGLYLHKFMRSDYDRALHDHPWGFITLILGPGYIEVHDQTPNRIKAVEWRGPGTILYRPPKWRHRVCLDNDRPTWSLVLVGPRVRKWGFWIDGDWCWWKKHNPYKNICEDHEVWNGGSE